jgi:hypothetical protein
MDSLDFDGAVADEGGRTYRVAVRSPEGDTREPSPETALAPSSACLSNCALAYHPAGIRSRTSAPPIEAKKIALGPAFWYGGGWQARSRTVQQGAQAMLTLRQCLEHVIALGKDYVLTEQGVEWSAVELLAALTRDHPDHLDLPMYLRLPTIQQDGAICQVTKTGYLLRYRICPRLSR